MKNHADYSVLAVTDEAIYLEDLNLGNKSVTNDAEYVVQAVIQLHGRDKKVVYKDTIGTWDELTHDGYNFLDFGPWRGTIPDSLI